MRTIKKCGALYLQVPQIQKQLYTDFQFHSGKHYNHVKRRKSYIIQQGTPKSHRIRKPFDVRVFISRGGGEYRSEVAIGKVAPKSNIIVTNGSAGAKFPAPPIISWAASSELTSDETWQSQKSH